MKLIPLTLKRVSIQNGLELRTRRDDLRTLGNVLDLMDSGKMKRGLLNSVNDLAEELWDIEENEWPATDHVGRFSREIMITPDVLDQIDSHLSSPPQGVAFIGGTFRALIGDLRKLKQDYDNDELDGIIEEDEEEDDSEEVGKIKSATKNGKKTPKGKKEPDAVAPSA